MKRTLVALLFLLAGCAGERADFDIVIDGATIVDGSGQPAFSGDSRSRCPLTQHPRRGSFCSQSSF